MKNRKKSLALLLALLLSLLPLFACGNGDTLIGGADGPTGVIVSDAADGGVRMGFDEVEGDAGVGGVDTPWDPEDYPAVTGAETLLLGDTPLDEEGWYSSKEEVALYLMAYGALPGTYITKKEARALGWEGGGLDAYAPGMCIGGDHFGNYEGSLPEADGRSYAECDIDTQGAKKRGAKRIIFSSDGLIFYTADHYKTFTLLTGEE